MTGLEIVLLIAGFSCLCISLFVARRTVPEQNQTDEVRTSAIWTEKEEQMILDRVNEILSDRQNELVDTTEEQMNRLCNDKIMAVDEFSKQVLEKIENNHQEVVFMYNMLNEKEKEVKDLILEPVKRSERSEEKPISLVEPSQTAISQLTSREGTKEKQKPVKKETEKKPTPQPTPVQTVPSPRAETPKAVGDVNSQIGKMYREGKSVLEISKELNIGQGEVKLVIALYGGKKR